MGTTLEAIRARLQASENNSNNFSAISDATFPFWNQPDGSTTVVRFLPDKDEDNPFFWVERNVIKLPFNGIVGEPTSKTVEVHVPCMELWGEECPVLKETRPWWKDDSLKDVARKYWKKRSYIFNGFVVSTDLVEETSQENPVRRFIIGPQIFKIIKAALMDSDIEVIPTDYERGLDFRITKTSKGGYSDYSTSNWARKETALTEHDLALIKEHGLFDLKNFLPNKPSPQEVEIIKEMFEASVEGQAYDPSRFGKYYKPFGFENTQQSDVVSETDVQVAETDLKSPTPSQEPAETKTAQDLLARIRNRVPKEEQQ